MYAIEAEGLRKTYSGGVEAAKGISFDVADGEVFGLLGPNGAGKSTTVGMLTTTILPTSGTARLAGHDVVRTPLLARGVSSVVFQEAVVDRGLSGRANLELHTRLWAVPPQKARRRTDELVEVLGLAQLIDRPVSSYSGGERRRLEIARALSSQPAVLFLDEPTVGLDPRIRHELLDVIAGLRGREELTILVTTHYLDEAQRLCDRVAIVHHGSLVALDALQALLAGLGREILEFRVAGSPERALSALRALGIAADDAFSVGARVTVPLHGPRRPKPWRRSSRRACAPPTSPPASRTSTTSTSSSPAPRSPRRPSNPRIPKEQVMSAIAESFPVAVPRPRRVHAAGALITLARRRASLTASNPRQILVPLLGPAILAMVVAPALKVATGGLRSHIDYESFVGVGTVGLVVPLSCIFAGLSVIVDRHSGAQRELLAAPVPRAYLVLGNLIVALVLSAFQVVVLIGLAALRGASFQITASGLGWFVAAALLFTVFMYGVAETLASRVAKQEEYIGATRCSQSCRSSSPGHCSRSGRCRAFWRASPSSCP